MSIVNQAEKDGILYDINDARVYTVDLGTLILTPDDPDNPKSFSGNTTLTAEQFLNLQNSELGFIKFTFNGTNIITAVNENLEYPEVTGLVTASTSMMMSGSFSTILVLAQYEGTLGETVPTQVIVVVDILADVPAGAKVVDFGTVDSDISDPDNPYTTTITQEKFEEALEADIAQFTTTSDDSITFRALKMQVGPGQSTILFTAIESEARRLMIMAVEQNGSYMLYIGMSPRLLSADDPINIENLSTSGASEGQVITKTSNGVEWSDIPAGATVVTIESSGSSGDLSQEDVDKILADDNVVIKKGTNGRYTYYKKITSNPSIITFASIKFVDNPYIDQYKLTVDPVLCRWTNVLVKGWLRDTDINAKFNSSNLPAGEILVSNGKGTTEWQNLPVFNQDLDKAGFTPAANTYYKHVGASGTNYDIGKIYFYTGSEYKAIDGSGSSESTYELSGTVSSGDTISDATAIAVLNAHKPIIVNGKRFEYQDANGFNLRYFNASLNGAIIHLIIMEYNTDKNEVLFIEQDVNDGIVYTTTEPTAPNTNGLMKLVVLNAQPTTKYAGWLYYITQ